MRWSRLLPVVVVCSTVPAPAAAAGVTQPIYSYDQAIRETVHIESTVDGDGDGARDRIAATIVRPKETSAGLRVPSIVNASPYNGGRNEVPQYPPPPLPRGGPADSFLPWSYDVYFVPRGYAYVTVDMSGTRGSEGCPVIGGREEVESTRAVVDWLTAAPWSTGKVGMMGMSYDGTLANAVATTGVPGLRTIVPINAISSWYEHYRSNGLVISTGQFYDDADYLARRVLTRAEPSKCADVIKRLVAGQDRDSGDYNAFWHERDFRKDIRASVLLVHGLNDWNVKPNQYASWWDTLGRYGVPRKLLLHQNGHIAPTAARGVVWIKMLHRWFDHWLHGIDTGIMREPAVDIEQSPGGTWQSYAQWPDPGARSVRLALGPGTLSPRPSWGTVGFRDDPRLTDAALVSLEPNPGRVVFQTPPVSQPVRISGTPRITVRGNADKTDTNLVALLVDYGVDNRVDYDAGTRIKDPEQLICPDQDNRCFRAREYNHVTKPYEIIARGWLDAQNRYGAHKSVPLVPGQDYRFEFTLTPDDYVIKPGHRIGLVIAGSEKEQVNWDATAATFTVSMAGSHLDLPIVGGVRALKF